MRGWIVVLAGLLFALGTVPMAPAAAQEAPAESEAEKKLLEVGRVAPDFTLPLVGGGEVTLSNLLKFGKAVLVVFWGIEPDDGGEAMPQLQKLHSEFEGKGLSTIAINPVEVAADVQDFIEEAKLQLPVAIDGKETNRAVTNVYRARELPTLYLLDPTGKVLWRSIGLKEPGLRAALEKAGVK